MAVVLRWWWRWAMMGIKYCRDVVISFWWCVQMRWHGAGGCIWTIAFNSAFQFPGDILCFMFWKIFICFSFPEHSPFPIPQENFQENNKTHQIFMYLEYFLHNICFYLPSSCLGLWCRCGLYLLTAWLLAVLDYGRCARRRLNSN